MKINELVQENDMSSFLKDLQKNNPKFKNLRIHGDPEHDELRRQDSEKRETDRAVAHQKSQDDQAQDHADLPHLEAEYAKMKKEYEALGGSDWQYADREQNLSAGERKARSMESGLHHLANRIRRAKKHGEQGVAEAAKWRSDPDAYDVDDEGNKTPRNPNSPKFGYDPLQRRADTANDAKTPRGKTAALKTSLKMAKGNKGVAGGDKKPYPKTWHDVDPKLGKLVDKMSPAEQVKKGFAHPDILKKSKEQGVAEGKPMGESATVGATSAANIGTVDAPHLSPGKARGKKSYIGSPGKSGSKAPPQPKVNQPKNKDGTAKNGLDIKGASLFGGPPIKRR